MRIALLHNPAAGSEDHSADDLTRSLNGAGHDVAYVAKRLSDLTGALHGSRYDLVLVAGGDGTVGKVACALAGWQVPISIVPLGTANNTARALGLPKRLKKLARSWDDGAKPTAFDLGLIDDGILRHRFSEAVGWGIFPQAIEQARSQPAKQGVRQTLRRDRKLFRSVVAGAKPRKYRIELDGRDCSGDYLLVEVMNVPAIGPQLELSPKSDPGDGHLELVLAGENERAALLRLTSAGRMEPGEVRVERGQRLRVEASEGVHHRDGRLERHPLGPRAFELGIEPSAIVYLR